MMDIVVIVAIAMGVPAIVWWAMRFGKAPPNAAIYPPALRALSVLFTLFFGVFAILAFTPNQMGASLAFLFGALGFGFCAADSFYYRLSWDSEGFAVRRLMGGSFKIKWAQVTNAETLPDSLFRLHLEHEMARTFTVSTIAIGAHSFIEETRRHVPPTL